MTLAFIFIIGLAIGSFSNVLIDRLPHDQSIMGRSHCDYCKKTLSGWELIPILSYIMQRGRCRHCGKKLSIQYPLVELWTGVLFVLTWMLFLGNIDIFSGDYSRSLFIIVSYLAIASCLNIIFFTDAKYQLIPDGVQVALALSVIALLYSKGYLPVEFFSRTIAAVVVMAPILALFIVTRGRGMGFADVKLSLIIGFLLGIKGGLLALYIGFLVGAVVGIVLIFGGFKKLKSRIAFGPFLIIGMIVMMIFSGPIFSFIHKYYGF